MFVFNCLDLQEWHMWYNADAGKILSTEHSNTCSMVAVYYASIIYTIS